MIARILILLSLPLASLAQDERAPVPRWYGTIKGGAVGSQPAADQGTVFGLGLGHNLTLETGLELELDADQTDFDAGFELERQSLQLNLVQVNRVPLWNPYFLIGVGARRYELPGQEDTDLTAAVAVGGMWDLNSYGVMLRVDARYRYTRTEVAFLDEGEGELSIGLVIPLGR